MICFSESRGTRGFMIAPSDTCDALAGHGCILSCAPELLQMGITEAQKDDVICRVSGAVPRLTHSPWLNAGSLKCEAEMPIWSQSPPAEL